MSNPSQPERQHRRRGRAGVWVLLAGLTVLAIAAVAFFYRPTSPVPQLVGMTQPDAQQALESASLRLGAVGEVGASTGDLGVVVAQAPPAGSELKRRTSVDITVTAAVATVALPDVAGLETAQAVGDLESLGFEVVAIDVLDTPDDVEVGTVIGQLPAAGVDWNTSQPVAVAVAAGPDDGTGTQVPDVIASSFDAAVKELANAALLALGITENPDDLERSDVDVQEQLPKPGVVVRQGSTVAVRMGQ